MNSRSEQANQHKVNKGRVWVLALIVLFITLGCSLASRLTADQETKIPLVDTDADAPLGLIAYVGTDGNIYTIDGQGQQQTAITLNGEAVDDPGPIQNIYQYPTWAPNGQKLAFVGFNNNSSAGPQAVLYTASSNGKDRVESYTNQNSFPFYLFWSPNSEFVTFLSNTADGMNLSLTMSRAAGGNSIVIGTGQPFYWDWSPDNQAIIVHTGGATSQNPDAKLAVITMDEAPDRTELDLNPGSFQAPAWSPDGDELVLTAINDAGDEELILAGRDGKVKQILAQLSGPTAFGWSPKGDRLAYTTPLEGDTTGLLNHLVLLDPAQPDREKEVVDGVVTAFFWSPDSRRIAYFTLVSDQQGETSQILAQSNPGFSLVVKLYDLESGETKPVGSFSPTEAFQQILPYFDQYQRSGTIWSPDSKNLVLAGLDDSGDPGIYVIGVEEGKLKKIADGDLAFWSWK
jgi:Tol biopolymer transport system component